MKTRRKGAATVKTLPHERFFKYVDVRPNGVETLKGDCTTRCLTFCLEMDYNEVKDEQRMWAE